MPELNVNNILQKQKMSKPKIEDVIPDYLDGDMSKAALDFVAYLRANKMSPTWANANAWKASYKGKGICYVRLEKEGFWDRKGLWVITPLIDHYDEIEDVIMHEGLQTIIWDNLYYCKQCHPAPCNIRDMTILGKEFKGLCGGRPPVWFWDPDETTINCIKRMLELEKKARAGLAQ